MLMNYQLLLLLRFFLILTLVTSKNVLRKRSYTDESEQNNNNDRRRLNDKNEETSAIHMFTPSSFTVIGPSVFPKPSTYFSIDAEPYLRPTMGKHRRGEDAVLVFAAEYGLNTYICFVESLRRTGYTGDIVFAVSALDVKNKQTEEYLKNTFGLVVYVVTLNCLNAELEEVDSAKGGMRVCTLDNMYAENGKPLKDARPARTIATTRYELYWLWALNYDPHSWLMLLDARDAYFQSNPFQNLPREASSASDRKDGVLHFFGENADATRIGKSAKNRKWLTNAYGDVVVTALEDKPTICSGSTMGEQIAMESYLRAMVAESDETGTKLMGADQGFHNYLYYSNKLGNAITIRSISVFDQGRGAINNLGAMRTAPLESWGNGRLVDVKNETSDVTVLNWDGTPSPVIHQFDRHQLLAGFIYKHKTKDFKEEYFAQKK